MKITDISSNTTSEEAQEEQTAEQYERNKRKRSLLERFNIPIEHLDFSYVEKSTDAREIERILRILRSGEEGTYPELERQVATRLEKLNPNSRVLRVQTPAVRTKELNKEERESVQTGLEEWLNDVSKLNKDGLSPGNLRSSKIFCEETNDLFDMTEFSLPIRGSPAAAAVTAAVKVTTQENDNKNGMPKAKDESRIKSWEYDKWDKFDADAELTKMDITDMKMEEWEKREKPKILEEQKKIEELMKSSADDVSAPKMFSNPGKSAEKAKAKSSSSTAEIPKLESVYSGQQSKKKTKPAMSVDRQSFIEEINEDDDDEKGETVNTSAIFKGKGPRRATVMIEDLNLSM